MCALTSSRLDDFSDIVTYVSTVMITILFFGGGVRHLGGGTSTLQIPQIEPFREMSDLLSKLYQVLRKIPYHRASFVSKTLCICPLWA